MINNKSHPFTLLEVVVAVAIFATVIMVASMGLLTVQQTWKKAHFHGRRLENLLKIDRVLDTGFRNIIPMCWEDEVAKKTRPVFTGESAKVTFATMHRITESNYRAIRYLSLFVENEALIAEYRASPILEWQKSIQDLNREILATGIESVAFLYAEETSGGKIELKQDWKYQDVDRKNHNEMPLGIQIEITWKDQTKRVWFRRTAGSGKYENLGNMLRHAK